MAKPNTEAVPKYADELSQARAMEFSFEGINPANFLREIRISPAPNGQWAQLSNWLRDYGWEVMDSGTSITAEWWAAPLPKGHSRILVTIEEALRRQAFRVLATHLREVGYNVQYTIDRGMVIGYGKCLLPGSYKKTRGRILYRGSPITLTMAAVREGFL